MSRFPSFRLSVKTGTGLCFCWSLPFLLVTDVQPPLCWWPRKFWTAALFGSRDWGKVFKVKSVFFFFFFLLQNRVYQKQDIFMLMRTLSTAKPSKAASLDRTSLRFANMLETTWKKKMVSARATMKLSLGFIFFILSCHPVPIEKCLKVFSVGCSLGRDWRGLAEKSQ